MEKEMQLVPYNLENAIIDGLKTKYMDLTIPPDDKAAYALVMSGLRECREIRLEVDSWHKNKKEWIVKAGKHFDAERRRVHSLVAPIEEHLAGIRKMEDDRKAAIQAEKERKERERIENIKVKISSIQNAVSGAAASSSDAILKFLTQLKAMPVDEVHFQEFTNDAITAKANVTATLEKAYKERLQAEEDAERIKKEKAEIEKIRLEQQVEAKRLVNEKAEIERKAKEEHDKIETERRALEDAKKAERERLERAEFERKAKEEAKARAEQAIKENMEREAKEKAEREEKERIEKERQERLRPDREKLLSYADFLLTIQAPHVESENAKTILSDSAKSIKRIAAMIRKTAKEM